MNADEPTQPDAAEPPPKRKRGRPKGPPKPPKERKSKKSTAREMEKRILEVYRIIIAGAEFHDIQEYANHPDRAWGLSKSSVRRLQGKALAMMKRHTETRADRVLARHLQQRRFLYARAIEAGDINAALAVAKDEAKLFGIYPSDKIEMTGKGGGPLGVMVYLPDNGRSDHDGDATDQAATGAPGAVPVVGG